MKTLIVTPENIDFLFPYQGTNKDLTIGNTLYLVKHKLPCVTHRKGSGNALTFSILTDKLPAQPDRTPVENVDTNSYYNANRWSLNDRYTRNNLFFMNELENEIIQLWHISRTALAGMSTVPTRHDRMTYVKKELQKANLDLIKDLSPKRLWFTIEDMTRVF